MEIQHRNPNFCLLILLLSFSTLSALSFPFSPIDNYLIDCGSTVNSTIDNRLFVHDSPFLHATQTIPIRAENPVPNSPPIYHTARVFTRPSKYVFQVRDPGTFSIRLHFHRSNLSNFVLGDSKFHVLVNRYAVLSNFSFNNENAVDSIIKEYLIWVDTEKLVITFMPSKNSRFGFVNAIEVISMPKDLILDTAEHVPPFEKNENFDGLKKQGLETVYRVNVGGPKVTPFNDSLWRTWVPDNEFLKSSLGSKMVYSSGRIRYQKGGASREVGPDNMYNSARVISSTNGSIPNVNITWEFPVVEGFKYLVRLHFCDIASVSLGLLRFNVYVNGYLAYKDLDLTEITYALASPFYADFVVDENGSGILSVSVGPSDMSLRYSIDGILNGVEIMKMNNSMGSFCGELSADLILKSWTRGNMGVLVPLVAVLCLLLSLSMVIRRRMIGGRDLVAWSPLPVDVSQVNLKHDNQ